MNFFPLQASYTAVVLFAYFDVKNNHPNEQPLIRYWPVDTFEFGVPFVQVPNLPKDTKLIHKINSRDQFYSFSFRLKNFPGKSSSLNLEKVSTKKQPLYMN
jgi:hypothetical protein